MIQYCTRCVMPATKPDLEIDSDGVCSACRAYERRGVVDWEARGRELENILKQYRDSGWWDCVVPVSGGKDSTYQVSKALEHGMHPLCVTGTTCDLSDIGRENISNIQKLGVDYIEFTTNREVRAKLNRIGLEYVGDISWPEHLTIFTIPVRVAVQYDIPLILWGENPQNEYGGPATSQESRVLNRAWLEEFGGLLGLRVTDVIGTLGITQHDMLPFTYPSDAELQRVGVTGLFLGHFIPWDGQRNALLSQARGMQTYHKPVEGTITNYENLDNHQTGIHDYFKFLKYGFGRATDQACLQIRRGRISRDEGLELVRRHDGRFPWVYLGKSLQDILRPLDMGIEEFQGICDRYTNRDLFKQEGGELVRERDGSLVKVNYDNC